jgi:hypothetical protein
MLLKGVLPLMGVLLPSLLLLLLLLLFVRLSVPSAWEQEVSCGTDAPCDHSIIVYHHSSASIWCMSHAAM